MLAGLLVLALALSPQGAHPQVHASPYSPASPLAKDPLDTFNATAAYAPRPPRLTEMSKKALWLEEKNLRPSVRVPQARLEQAARARSSPGNRQNTRMATELPPPGSRIEPITTLFSLRLKE